LWSAGPAGILGADLDGNPEIDLNYGDRPMDLPLERPIAPPATTARATTQDRLMSLDALRGFDMFWIIGGYWIVRGLAKGLDNEWFNRHILPQIDHTPWAGFTAWDLIMPLFLFMVGTAMPLSFAKRLARGDSKGRLYRHILYRVVLLWVLGMIAQGRLLEYDLSKLQLYSNTLQTIAAGYLISSLLVLNLRQRWQFVVTAALLLLYWGLLALVPVPGQAEGHFGQHDNLAIYIDTLVLGHFKDQTNPPYTWILSSMAFGAMVMLGVFAGQLLRSNLGKLRKVLILLAAGLACLLAGWAWGLIFPIIKHLFTSSMVLFAAGWSFLLLGLFYLIIDVLHLRRWSIFFVVIGMNAIAVYMATHVFDFRALGDIFVRGLSRWTGNWQDFIRALAGFAILWLILFYMYRKRTFIKI
jgi:predicted acyltransferase